MILLALLACDPAGRADQVRTQDPERAAALYERAGDLSPDQTARYTRVLLSLDQTERAEAVWAARSVPDGSAESLLTAGLLLVRQGDLISAEALFAQGVERAQETGAPLPELATNLCVARVVLGQDPLPACQDAVEVAPTDPKALLGLAQASVDAGLGAAGREAVQVVATMDLSAQDRAWLGEIELELGQVAEACAHGLQSGVQQVWVARACLASGRYAQGEALLESMSPDEPQASALLLRVALNRAQASNPGGDRQVLLARAERWDRALGDFEDAGVMTDRGRLAALQGEPARAERIWQDAARRWPDEPAPRIDLARALAERGQVDQAEAWLLEGSQDPVADLALRLEAARLYLAHGDPWRAHDAARAVVDDCARAGLRTCRAEGALLLAILDARAGDADASLGWLSEAMDASAGSLRARGLADPDLARFREDPRYQALLEPHTAPGLVRPVPKD
jgi:tetratricopeptide (TPR) repeat protein